MKWKREYNCGELRASDGGRTVNLAGWVEKVRDLGGVVFFNLIDREGKIQISLPPESEELQEKAKKMASHYVVAVQGVVKERPEENINPDMETGEIEIEATQIEILNTCERLPLSIDDRDKVSDEVRMRYRYLDFHRDQMKKSLKLRHRAIMSMRKYLDSLGFLEVETPILTKSTPEGARDYLVPSRVHRGKFYALPQSPQLFKQLIMVGGLDKYFQIARCFRDEDLRADRQPEFTQVDIEMSFVDQDDVFSLTEGLYSTVFEECLGIKLDLPFPRYTHAEVMEKYGTDKPDLRFGMELVSLAEMAEKSDFNIFKKIVKGGGMVKAICAPGGADQYSRKNLSELETAVGDYGAKGLAWMKIEKDKINSPIAKFFSEDLQEQIREVTGATEGDLLLILAGDEKVVHPGLAYLRHRLGRELGLRKEGEYRFAWVVDFPLFIWDEEEERFESEHHPFTSPHPDDLEYLDSDPLKVRSQAYDLVLNGWELGSGSIRIHQMEVQEKIFQLLEMDEEEIEARFGFFLEALNYGAPPHGGIAPGIDRTIMIMGGFTDIREVIAFPKTAQATCLTTDSPGEVYPRQLEDLGLEIRPEKKK